MKYLSMSLVSLVLALLMVTFSFAGKKPGEREHAERIAIKYNAKVEVKLWDHTRVDLLNDTHAYEVDWVRKYAEGVGQALYYGVVTNKKPALILLVRDLVKESRYIYRAQTVCARAGVELHLEVIPADPVRNSLTTAPPIYPPYTPPPVKVYMVYDPVGKDWFGKTLFNLSSWGPQTAAEVWTSRKACEKGFSIYLGERSKRSKIKAFVIIPAKDNK